MYVNQKVENSTSDLPIGQHKISCPDCQGTRSKKQKRQTFICKYRFR